MNPLISTVLDLDAALGGNAGLLLGGGLGLYLKQEHLRATGAKTLLPFSSMPAARTTEDIDLFLRAEVIANEAAVARYRQVLNDLGFTVVQGSEWLKFKRTVEGSEVLLDVMVGPLGEHAGRIKWKSHRVHPKGLSGKDGLHAFSTKGALGIEIDPMPLTVTNTRLDGTVAACQVLIPRAFPYALMKLGALRDRINNPKKQDGRHHAMDLYRIVGLLTQEEEDASAAIARQYVDAPELAAAMATIDALLAPPQGLGRIRLLEYQRANRDSIPAVDPDLLVSELRRLLTPTGT